MNPQKKAITRQQAEAEEHQEAQTQQQTQDSTQLEFATVEELLRHDTLHTPVPPAIAQRLQESLNQLPASSRPPWWRRIFGDSSL
jgi:hypothetical protein